VKAALVTGAAGFVGRHMTRRLLDDGWDVLGFDLVDTPVAHGRYMHTQSDIRTYFQSNVSNNWDLVVHCAAVVGGRLMIDGSPFQLAAEDLSIDAEMWRWALRTKPGAIVYYSSSAAYPVEIQNLRLGLPSREEYIRLDDVRQPDQTYGWVKLTGEQMARHAANLGLRVHVLRPFSGYGSDQDLSYPFPAIIDRARRRADPFEIWGPGTQVRDWIHIDDVVAATMAAVEQDVRGPVNLCTGQATPFLELAKLVTSVAGYSPEIVPRPDMPAGVFYRVGDPTRMNEFYTPKVTLEEGIARALR
jgi:nucleoside-diphosphate-sugar epimerase